MRSRQIAIVLVGSTLSAVLAHAAPPPAAAAPPPVAATRPAQRFGPGFWGMIDTGPGNVWLGAAPPELAPSQPAYYGITSERALGYDVSLAVGHAIGPRLALALRAELLVAFYVYAGGSSEPLHGVGWFPSGSLDLLACPFASFPLFLRAGVGYRHLSLLHLDYDGVQFTLGVGVDLVARAHFALTLEARFEPTILAYPEGERYTRYDRAWPITLSLGVRVQ